MEVTTLSNMPSPLTDLDLQVKQRLLCFIYPTDFENIAQLSKLFYQFVFPGSEENKINPYRNYRAFLIQLYLKKCHSKNIKESIDKQFSGIFISELKERMKNVLKPIIDEMQYLIGNELLEDKDISNQNFLQILNIIKNKGCQKLICGDTTMGIEEIKKFIENDQELRSELNSIGEEEIRLCWEKIEGEDEEEQKKIAAENEISLALPNFKEKIKLVNAQFKEKIQEIYPITEAMGLISDISYEDQMSELNQERDRLIQEKGDIKVEIANFDFENDQTQKEIEKLATEVKIKDQIIKQITEDDSSKKVVDKLGSEISKSNQEIMLLSNKITKNNEKLVNHYGQLREIDKKIDRCDKEENLINIEIANDIELKRVYAEMSEIEKEIEKCITDNDEIGIERLNSQKLEIQQEIDRYTVEINLSVAKRNRIKKPKIEEEVKIEEKINEISPLAPANSDNRPKPAKYDQMSSCYKVAALVIGLFAFGVYKYSGL